MSGKWFDELEVGQVFQHALRRTLTETDNLLFTTMTHNPAQLHLDVEYCRTETEFGGVLINSMFTMGLVVGISVGDTTLGTAVANLSIDNTTLTFLAKAQNRHAGLIDVNDINAAIMLITHDVHRTKVEPHGFAEFN